MSSHRLAALLAISLLPLAWVPPAAAHCPPGSAGALLGAVSTCQFNDEAEVAVDAFNAANGGQLVMVLVKDVGFHPPVVTIRSGGTVLFVYADTDQSLQHDPRSSGGCASGAPLPDPVGCVPVDARAGLCFDVTDDDGIPMSYNGQTYPLTFRHFPASGLTQKSRGFMTGTAVGDLTGAQPFRNCAPGNTLPAPGGDVVLPYHCGVHGASGTQQKQMRGAIVIEG